MTSRGALAAVAVVAVLAGGCGSGVDSNVGVAGALPAPSGSLRIALPGGPGHVDPLAAATPSEELLVAQINEPLVERLTGPYDDTRRVAGLAMRVRPAGGGTVWHLELRSGIRFQDGSRMDAAAVIANATRWRTTAQGRALLPGLVAADSPRPGFVRLFLDAPDPAFAKRLAAPQLGLVSQRALSPSSGEAATMVHSTDTGTGPFELRQHSRRTALVARNAAWWGTGLRLGPAIDSIAFSYVPTSDSRARMLRRGAVDVAVDLESAAGRALRRDPLVDVQSLGGTVRGVSRSVRGIHGEIPSLQEAWLTTIGG